MMRSHRIRVLLASALGLAAFVVQAQPRAWLDRDRIALGETATLNIEVDQQGRAPDYAPLRSEFELSGHTSTRRFESVDGRSRMRMLYAVALRPRRGGTIAIPSLPVGSQRTAPLSLTVLPASAVPARAGGAVFIESEADDPDPYVQQAVGFVVRLYYSVPLLSGQLDQAAPDDAALRRVGEDVQYSREIGGRRYNVVERRYLLIAERSGALTIPGARFQGQGVGGFFDDLFGDGRRALAATATPRILHVRPAPVDAPQPWLPLQDLRLRYTATPRQARAGEAATVVVEAVADGASAAQVPELQLGAGNGAQVFAEPAQVDEAVVAGRPRVTVTRRFAVVPARAGTLRVDGPRLGWWNVRAGAARTATLPALSLTVAPGVGAFALPPPAESPTVAGDDGRVRVPGVQGRILPWALATVVFALLWFFTFLWALHRRPAAVVPADAARPRPMGGSSSLRRALDAGQLGDVADSLCALATPPVSDLDALREQLADPAQRDAVDALQRARWGGGDGTAARVALRAAFRDGPRWRKPAHAQAEPLPPLYPPA